MPTQISSLPGDGWSTEDALKEAGPFGCKRRSFATCRFARLGGYYNDGIVQHRHVLSVAARRFARRTTGLFGFC